MPTVAAVIVLIGLLAMSGARLTWGAPTVTVQAEQAAPGTAAATVKRAEQLAAARHELTALRGGVLQVPAIEQSMHDRMQLLAAVTAGNVPIEALERHDHRLLRQAVTAGHVPKKALEAQQ